MCGLEGVRVCRGGGGVDGGRWHDLGGEGVWGEGGGDAVYGGLAPGVVARLVQECISAQREVGGCGAGNGAPVVFGLQCKSV